MKTIGKILLVLMFGAVLFYGAFCITKYVHGSEHPTHLVKIPTFEMSVPYQNVPLPAGDGFFGIYLCFPKEGEHIIVYHKNGSKIGCEFGNPIITFPGDQQGIGVFTDK